MKPIEPLDPNRPPPNLAPAGTYKNAINYKCARCSDAGWYQVEKVRKDGTVEDKTLERCECRKAIDADNYQSQERRRLLELDGLTEQERELKFADLVPMGNIVAARDHLTAKLRTHSGGMITIDGPPGTGKSALLICTVNAGRQMGISAAYRRVSAFFNELRNQYQDGNDFQERWDTVLDAHVLAIDEIDKWSRTDWASERFDELIDERYRRATDRMTILAANNLDVLSPYNRSRLKDAMAAQYTLGGLDIRTERR